MTEISAVVTGTKAALEALAELTDDATGEAVVEAGGLVFEFDATLGELRKAIFKAFTLGQEVVVVCGEFAHEDDRVWVFIENDRWLFKAAEPTPLSEQVEQIRRLLDPVDPWGKAPTADFT